MMHELRKYIYQYEETACDGPEPGKWVDGRSVNRNQVQWAIRHVRKEVRRDIRGHTNTVVDALEYIGYG